MKLITINILLYLTLLTFSPLLGRGYKVLRVIDGDTFDIDLNLNGKIDNEERIRLLGVDCFEAARNEKLLRQAERWNVTASRAYDLGLKATEFARKHLHNRFVELEYSGERKGSFGRTLAYVNTGGKDFGSMLLENKLAFVYNKNTRHKKYKEYVRKEKLRLQLNKTDEIVSWKDAHKYVGRYITVEGRITDCYNSGKVCFLNFHKKYRMYLSAVIFQPNFYAFPHNPGIYYRGKTVRICGTVSMYKGRPQMILSSRNQIKVVD